MCRVVVTPLRGARTTVGGISTVPYSFVCLECSVAVEWTSVSGRVLPEAPTVRRQIGQIGPRTAPAADNRLMEESTNRHAEFAKWSSLAMLVVQNSSLFVVTRYSRVTNVDGGPMYLSSVVVLMVEASKMLVCLAVLASQGPHKLLSSLRHSIWIEREQTARLGLVRRI